jgi:hypothetical protein
MCVQQDVATEVRLMYMQWEMDWRECGGHKCLHQSGSECRIFCFLQLNDHHGLALVTNFTIDSSDRSLFFQMLFTSTLRM